MQKTLGGDRLGSGQRMKVDLKNYERSTHDLGYLWRSTMSAGTLVPFLCEVALPGDTFDIKLNCDVKTHPTLGPLFGSFKVQLDIFEAPIRLYHSALHNNTLGIGNNMQTVQLPIIVGEYQGNMTGNEPDIDNAQINPSNILAYLGIRGWGYNTTTPTTHRYFNAIPFLAYWEIFKNYYANKQEEIGAYINPPPNTPHTVNSITVDAIVLPFQNAGTPQLLHLPLAIHFTGAVPDPYQIMVRITNSGGQTVPIGNAFHFTQTDANTLTADIVYIAGWEATYWDYAEENTSIEVGTFNLEIIDTIRQQILSFSPTSRYQIDLAASPPYNTPLNINKAVASQCGLAVKTYQSDIFNNWISTEWLDGAGGVNEITAVSTTGDSFTIDSLILARKVYDMLNRIALSGGSYDDWLDAVYTHERYTRCESPMYHGGLSKELVFDQVVSNSSSEQQPLGTLAGRGQISSKHKGGDITIKVNEPSYIMGIVSLTPRIDYSQGNKWHTKIYTMNDLHKPALDEIGFQELITEQMAWWDTHWDGTKYVTKSAGKQPAWINYMTNYNQTYGNFAIQSNEMFMTLNRRYQADDTGHIQDLTTYINPAHYNFIFAQTSLDAQNFWTQIAVDMIARRKMSAKVMPNL